MAQQDRERGERIAELRKAAGYTSAGKLSEALGVNYRSVQNWEAGKGISEDNVKELAELLAVTREYILYGPQETPDLIGAANATQTGATQLDRVEAKLDVLLEHFDLSSSLEGVFPSPPGVLAQHPGSGSSSARGRTRQRTR